MAKENEDYVYSRIGMALISTQRVEFITGKLLEGLETFDQGAFKITTFEFLERTTKSKKAIKTLGTIFGLLKLNPKLVIEEELNSYLKKRNFFVHEFWLTYTYSKSEKNTKEIIDFCCDFGKHSQRMESFFKGFVYFLSLRYVKDESFLLDEIKEWGKDFKYFMKSLKEKKLT